MRERFGTIPRSDAKTAETAFCVLVYMEFLQSADASGREKSSPFAPPLSPLCAAPTARLSDELKIHCPWTEKVVRAIMWTPSPRWHLLKQSVIDCECSVWETVPSYDSILLYCNVHPILGGPYGTTSQFKYLRA